MIAMTEEKREFQYFLRDGETVVNFDAPVEVLREYLKESIESIAEINTKINDIEIHPGDISSNEIDRYRRLRRALINRLALKQRLNEEIQSRGLKGKNESLKNHIIVMKLAIKKRDKIIKDALAAISNLLDLDDVTLQELRDSIKFVRASRTILSKTERSKIWAEVHKSSIDPDSPQNDSEGDSDVCE